MEALLSLLNEQVLINFLLLFTRVAAFMALLPIFEHQSFPLKTRAGLSLFLTIFLFSIVEPVSNVNESNFLAALLTEATLGLIAGMLINIIFDAVKIIGEFIGYATALSMANFFDPAAGTNLGIIAQFLFYIALAIFFEAGLYEMTIVMMVKSFSMVHLGSFDIFSFDGITILISEINRMFAFAFSFAFPLFFIGFIMDVYYGYGTKSMPAFSPFVITFQLKFAFIFLFMMWGLDVFSQNFVNYFIQKFN